MTIKWLNQSYAPIKRNGSADQGLQHRRSLMKRRRQAKIRGRKFSRDPHMLTVPTTPNTAGVWRNRQETHRFAPAWCAPNKALNPNRPWRSPSDRDVGRLSPRRCPRAGPTGGGGGRRTKHTQRPPRASRARGVRGVGRTLIPDPNARGGGGYPGRAAGNDSQAPGWI